EYPPMAGGAGRYTAAFVGLLFTHNPEIRGWFGCTLWLAEKIYSREEVILLMNEYKTISVTSIMTPAPLETASRTDNVDTIIRIMTVNNKSSVIILNDLKHPEGIITERDIVRRLVFESKDAKLTQTAEIMSSPL